MGNYIAPSSKATDDPVAEFATSTPSLQRYTSTKLASKDGYTTNLLFTSRASAPRHTIEFTSKSMLKSPTTRTTSDGFVTSSTKHNNGFHETTAAMSSEYMLQRPTPAKMAMDDTVLTTVVSCLAGTLLLLCFVITGLIILRKHSRGKTLRFGGNNRTVTNAHMMNPVVTESKNTVPFVTSHFDSQEYTSIDEGSDKTQAENLYESINVDTPESASNAVYHEPGSNRAVSESRNTAHRQADENEGAFYADDGLYLTPDVHENKRKHTDAEGRYSVIWPAPES